MFTKALLNFLNIENDKYQNRLVVLLVFQLQTKMELAFPSYEFVKMEALLNY